MKRLKLVCTLAMGLIVLMGMLTLGTAAANAQEDQNRAENAQTVGQTVQQETTSGAPYYAIALVMGISCLSAAYAVGKVGAAALGAAAEKPELLGKAIVFVGLGEGIAIFGLIISLMLINKL